ncbi:hypothetical protein JQ557_34540 [Bradyrhizobium sp. U87765 SZCCT0131]|nr:hypothetical protein [Bradyrhizobium sp. U87765 SZCCT0131]MBR1265739.1 hypothetical protein [Bradyrhizobium sp. U87765 SZCCT0134]MBR1309290.1 hypothetical protein [Bradyrhizobium sp. U87765 SZCCT0110]MBR1324118.1 hypothetical protein [Bradyrhizobium sp. U87765 SZCCT0109]MBR1352551.1 hypothetical protein [Bradyrhizobium sp. U87765 SZCCT0048]
MAPKAASKAAGKAGDNRRGALIGLLIAAVLLVVGLWLTRELTRMSRLQDCVMSGRTNCDTIDLPSQ